MARYFDKDFFKFLLGFVLIISISLIIISIVRGQQFDVKEKPVPVTNVATPAS